MRENQKENDATADGGPVVRPAVRILPDGRLSRRDAATYLGVKEKTLAQWASQGRGPPSVHVGNRVFYFRDELDRFIRADR